jgi:hypothetical protein
MSARPAAHLRAACIALACAGSQALAAPENDIQELREQLRQLKQSYEQRIEALERRLVEAEKAVAQPASPASAASAGTARAVPGAGESGFNPAISLILSGTYTDLSRDPDTYEITGFIPSLGETAPPPRSFSLGESELTVSASVDPWFRGYFTAALTPENEVEVEEAYVQTLALSNGFTVKGGRFFSGVGYLNELHPHAWDFADPPLAYKAFFGNQLGGDGVQLKWVAPTELYAETGIEGARYLSFPANDGERDKNGLMSGAVFLRLGGDVGASHGWRAGLSYVQTEVRDRAFETETTLVDESGGALASRNSFDGTSKTWIADFVWKWAPEGNPVERNFKLQGEYFWRREAGTLGSSLFAADDERYSSRQEGWYLQGVYRFLPRWRAGLRYDRLDSGEVAIGLVSSGTLGLDDLAVLRPHRPRRATAMLDWSPSEFSRLRFQVARDEARLDAPDTQLWLQYIMSLGAHGAHRF